MSKLSELNQANKRIAEKLSTGKFKDTGVKYSAEQAVADHINPALRLTAQTSTNGQLTWKQGS